MTLLLETLKVGIFDCKKSKVGSLSFRPVAQLVEHRAVMLEVVSSTSIRPSLRVLK